MVAIDSTIDGKRFPMSDVVVERAARIMFDRYADAEGEPHSDSMWETSETWEFWIDMARAALAAALPTPEEHARGIEAAAEMMQIAVAQPASWKGRAYTVVAAYLSAVGLAP